VLGDKLVMPVVYRSCTLLTWPGMNWAVPLPATVTRTSYCPAGSTGSVQLTALLLTIVTDVHWLGPTATRRSAAPRSLPTRVKVVPSTPGLSAVKGVMLSTTGVALALYW
jgi:hypothetical protein